MTLVVATVPRSKENFNCITWVVTPQAAIDPKTDAITAVVMPSNMYSSSRVPITLFRGAPRTLRTIESYTRRRCPLIIAPARTRVPATMATPAVSLIAKPRLLINSLTVSKTSRTRIAVTFGNLLPTISSTTDSRDGSVWTVAKCVCVAFYRRPGEYMKMKFIRRLRHCTSRRLAMVAVILRPSILVVIVSPGFKLSASAALAASDTSGGPL